MGIRDRIAGVFGRRPARPPVSVYHQAIETAADLDLPLIGPYVPPAALEPMPLAALALSPPAPLTLVERRETANAAVDQARRVEAMTLAAGLAIDYDDHTYRRITDQAKQHRRDLSPLQQDRMLEICWFQFEQNPLAKRLISLMTDLIIGDGWSVEASDSRIQEVIDLTWNHRINQLATNCRSFHTALALNGELILPVEGNPITGRPILGFVDPWQVKDVIPDPKNVLIHDYVLLKPIPGQTEGQRLKIVREDPLTGRLEGEVFYFAINKLPNSSRGRSDLLPMADWLDLYDQLLFAEVERINLLTRFVWDYKIEGATPAEIKEKLKLLGDPKAGSVFGHNEKESLEARTPDLKAGDRSEAGRMLRAHIAGSYGFPTSYLGDVDSNHATIQGQNDVLMKTPAARQREFAAFIDQIVRYSIDHSTAKNRALFRGADLGYRIRMPEIAAKDLARAGTVLSGVVTAMDTAMAGGFASKEIAVTVMVAMLKHLGVEADPNEILEAAEKEAEERQAKADEMQASIAAGRSSGRGNPPIPDDKTEDEDERELAGAATR